MKTLVGIIQIGFWEGWGSTENCDPQINDANYTCCLFTTCNFSVYKIENPIQYV